MKIDLLTALSLLADNALRNREPPPVIETDLASALLLRQMIENSLGAPDFVFDFASISMPGDSVVQFNGVKIKARRHEN